MKRASRSLKRGRDTTTAASVRSALASRVAPGIPPFWRRAASAAGASSIDTFLVSVGRSVLTAMRAVAESAETARSQLFETRSALHAAVDLRCDELAMKIESSESSKAASLEQVLVAVDAALEHWRVESGAVREAVSSLSDADLELQHTALSSRLDDMEAQLHALPTDVVDIPIVGLLADAATLLSSIAGFGHVIAPLPLTSAALTVEGVPARVRPGTMLHLRLSLDPRHAAQSVGDLKASIGRLMVVTQVDATLHGGEGDMLPLQATLAPDSAHHCLRVSLEIPISAVGMSLEFAIFVAGHAITRLPARIPVKCGLASQLTLKCAVSRMIAPCIGPDGRVYCPIGKGHKVLVFDACGDPLAGLPVVSLELSSDTSWSTCFVADSPSLLFADNSVLVAVDPASYTIRWRSAAGSIKKCGGIAALPSLGVVIVCCLDIARVLYIHRLSDGRRVGSVAVPGLFWSLAADPVTAVVYGSVKSVVGSCGVHSWSCVSDGAGVRIASLGPATAAGASDNCIIVAVVPPAPGKRVSNLVVTAFGTPELRVFSLPDLALVHTHTLDGMRVVGLAADPWGESLAVCDVVSQALHVLAWPLPGMPLLQ